MLPETRPFAFAQTAANFQARRILPITLVTARGDHEQALLSAIDGSAVQILATLARG